VLFVRHEPPTPLGREVSARGKEDRGTCRVTQCEAIGSCSAPDYFFFGAAFAGAAFAGAALAGAALGLASGFDGLLFAGSDFFTAIGLTSF